MKKSIGYVFLVLSCVAWLLIALLPFVDISKGQLVGATTFLIIAGEVLFFSSAALLGKEVWGRIKGVFKRNE